MTDAEKTRQYFRVSCELQVRFRVIDDEELQVFKSYALRPSPYSSLRNELENQLQAMDIREESKFLFERGFQLLMNIDQRLERLEEQMHLQRSGAAHIPDSYEWVHGDLGAGGLAFSSESKISVKPDQTVLLDCLLPSLPEYRFVVAAKVLHTEKKKLIGTEFLAIHEDDREFIHRFVIQRERELLRARATAKKGETDKPSES
ncbi:MAG: hypothetical protein JWQ35_1041 [Bacteriovoracaceae bacterium]|nr:hypothetical protein [Bacteriovoracaceae bacterium]